MNCEHRIWLPRAMSQGCDLGPAYSAFYLMGIDLLKTFFGMFLGRVYFRERLWDSFSGKRFHIVLLLNRRFLGMSRWKCVLWILLIGLRYALIIRALSQLYEDQVRTIPLGKSTYLAVPFPVHTAVDSFQVMIMLVSILNTDSTRRKKPHNFRTEVLWFM